MFVHTITVQGFRNLASQTLTFDNRVTVIVGRNGQGKTSLLEAIYLLAHPKSFRTSKSRELISWSQEESCSASAEIRTGDGSKTISFCVEGGRRSAMLNGKRIESASAFYGNVIAVVFTPDELQLVKGPPLERRSFLDRTLAMVDTAFVEASVQYHRALRHRNALLSGKGLGTTYADNVPSRGGNTIPPEALTPWTALLIEYGLVMAAKRAKFVKLLNERFTPFYSRILSHDPAMQSAERVSLEYESDFMLGSELLPREELVLRFEKHAERERRLRSTVFGVHRDDLQLYLDTGLGPKQARTLASQGQARSIALALKFCAVGFLKEQSGENPVLLLDDVESELDPLRRTALYELLKGLESQVFLSTTEMFTGLQSVSESIGYLRIEAGRTAPL